jgi:hypothetical protein
MIVKIYFEGAYRGSTEFAPEMETCDSGSPQSPESNCSTAAREPPILARVLAWTAYITRYCVGISKSNEGMMAVVTS